MANIGAILNYVVYAALGVSIMLNLQFISFEKKLPSMRQIRMALQKSKQLAFIHDPEGSVSIIPINLIQGSNQLDFGKDADKYSIKFKPRGMNEAEFIDRKIACFHYIGEFPHNLPVKGISSLSRFKRHIEARGINTTTEKLNTLVHRDLSQPIADIRANMVPGSEQRISDEEMEKLARVQKELQGTKNTISGPFVFGDCHDFLHGVGMSAAISLREWKSFIIATARGEMQPKAFMLDSKSIGMILIMAAVAYVISKAGTVGQMSGIKIGT